MINSKYKDLTESVEKVKGIRKGNLNGFFTENFFKKLKPILENPEKIKEIIENRTKVIKRFEEYSEMKILKEKYKNYNLEENLVLKENVSEKELERAIELESDEKFLNFFKEINSKGDEKDDIGKKLIIYAINLLKSKSGLNFEKIGEIENKLKFNENISNNKTFIENKDFFFNLLFSEEFKYFATKMVKIKNTFEKILQENENSTIANVKNILANNYIEIEEFLKNHGFNLNSNLNKQDIASSNLNEGQYSSWNRHIAGEKIELINENEIEKLEEISSLYLDFCNSISNDEELRKRLMREASIPESLENIYFKPLSKKDIVRIDATIGDNNAIYEFDDFPRGIGTTYLFDIKKKGESNWPKIISENLESGEKILFLIHKTASSACKHEHKEMVRFLNDYEGIGAIFCDSEEFLENYEKREDGIYYNGEKIGAVWHHLMVTPEAGEILPILDEENVSILPNYHFSSNKGVQAIIWEKYKSGKLDEKYLPLISEGFFAESLKLNSLDESFSFAGKKYNSLEDFFSDEENIKNNFNNLVLKVIGAENAEGVTVFATLTKVNVKKEIEKLREIFKNGLKDGVVILLQENKPHTVKEVLVYNSTSGNIEKFEGNSINRIFLNGEGEIISGMSQITKASSIIKGENGKKEGLGTAHGMTDMVITSI